MLSRRDTLRGGLALGATALAPSAGFRALAAETVMRLYWWGTPTRTERTLGVARLFEAANAGVKINGEVGGADYWSKLTTMIAGGNAPDIYQLEPGRFPDYSRRGATRPLDDYLGKIIRTDRLSPGVLALGTVDGKVTGMPLSLNAFALLYHAEPFKEAGIEPPTATTTWDQFARLCTDLTKAMGKKNVWAVGNCSRYMQTFQSWLLQRGKLIFTPDGRPGFDAKDGAEWFAYWDALAKAGGCANAEVQALDKANVDSNQMARGNAVMTLSYSNLLAAYQAVAKSPLDITSLPVQGAATPSGLFYRPGLHWSIASTAKSPELAARFIDFFINDVEAGKVLGVERGAPVNRDVMAAIAPTIDPLERKVLDYLKAIEGRVVAYPPPYPLGTSEFDERSFRSIADMVAFGQLSPTKAGEQLLADALRIIKP